MDRKKYLADYYQKNKDRIDPRNREWQRTHPVETYLYDVKRRYGLSKEEFLALPNYCQICRATERLCVDHKGKKVRGRLRRSCNSALGLFKDNPIILQKAMEYLNESEPILPLLP